MGETAATHRGVAHKVVIRALARGTIGLQGSINIVGYVIRVVRQRNGELHGLGVGQRW